MLTLRTSHNRMGIRISRSLYFPFPKNKIMAVFCGINRVQHHSEIAGGRILHSHGHIHAGRYKPMLLVFYRSCTDSHVGEDIIQISMIIRIQHLIRCRKSAFLEYPDMHTTNR